MVKLILEFIWDYLFKVKVMVQINFKNFVFLKIIIEYCIQFNNQGYDDLYIVKKFIFVCK